MNTEDIGHWLVKEGRLTQEQLTQALEYQLRLPKSQMMSLQDILLDFEYISRQDIHSYALRHPLQSQANYARQAENFSFSDAAEAPVKESTRQPEPEKQRMLGEILLQEGYLQEWQLVHALCTQKEYAQSSKRLGDLLVELGYTSPDLVAKALMLQKIEAEINRPALPSAPPAPEKPPRLGDLLLKSGVIQDWQLKHALSLQLDPTHGHKGLGTLLVQLGYARQDVVAQALELQRQRRKLTEK